MAAKLQTRTFRKSFLVATERPSFSNRPASHDSRWRRVIGFHRDRSPGSLRAPSPRKTGPLPVQEAGFTCWSSPSRMACQMTNAARADPSSYQ
ncbi:hypothetical protein LIA77_07832 [Sarocladium implicatum]|nr:hypothetical protein LIA77_07832 [Sarocladium implicatum]